MPKRKRDGQGEDGGRFKSRRKDDIKEKIATAKKLLHRTLKTARGFERQKLGKRLKNATTANKTEEATRISREIKALKELDLAQAGEWYLYKTLLKIKTFEKTGLLPAEIQAGAEKKQGIQLVGVEKAAMENVTSGIFNIKTVKDVMAQIVKDMCFVLGVSTPVKRKAQAETKQSMKATIETISDLKKTEGTETGSREHGREDVDLEGFHSESDEGSCEVTTRNDIDIDSETLSRYTALLGDSSDEESFDDEVYKKSRTVSASSRVALSSLLSPSQSDQLTQSASEPEFESKNEHNVAASRSAAPPLRKVVAKSAKSSKGQPTASTFLPSLMGGYFSGSDSEASDLEDDIPQVRKNRPGQMARRAIFEKKFGAKANHIQKGLPRVGTAKDDGWDARRGATEGKIRRGRDRGAFGNMSTERRQAMQNFRHGTGDNAISVGERKGMEQKKRRDDTGLLHASWAAAKKAKMEQKNVTFAGKKVVFD